MQRWQELRERVRPSVANSASYVNLDGKNVGYQPAAALIVDGVLPLKSPQTMPVLSFSFAKGTALHVHINSVRYSDLM